MQISVTTQKKVKALKTIMTKQAFHDFYTGIWENEIAGEFVEGSPKDTENKKRVDEFLAKLITELDKAK